jgi:hypothetical protein
MISWYVYFKTYKEPQSQIQEMYVKSHETWNTLKMIYSISFHEISAGGTSETLEYNLYLSNSMPSSFNINQNCCVYCNARDCFIF